MVWNLVIYILGTEILKEKYMKTQNKDILQMELQIYKMIKLILLNWHQENGLKTIRNIQSQFKMKLMI